MIYDLIASTARSVPAVAASSLRRLKRVMTCASRNRSNFNVARCMEHPAGHRESTLKAFRNGQFRVLVATDVAARGIHIQDIDLVINCEPPYLGRTSAHRRADVDTYVHRSGRTGRAGRKGCCITLFTHRQEAMLGMIEKGIGNKLIRIGPPQPAQLLASVVDNATGKMIGIPSDVVKHFVPHAEKLLRAHAVDMSDDSDDEDEMSLDSKKCATLLARALASMTGYFSSNELSGRSLLSSGRIPPLPFTAVNRSRMGYVWAPLRREVPVARESIRGMRVAADEHNAVFDVPNEHATSWENAFPKTRSSRSGHAFTASVLPKLKVVFVQNVGRSW